LRDVSEPEEEEIETLCKFLTTVGPELDRGKSSHMMQQYYDQLADIIKEGKLPGRINFMIMDLLDLRKANWHGKGASAAAKGPKTIAEIHQDAQKAKAEADVARYSSQNRSQRERTSARPNLEQMRSERGADGGWNTVKSAGKAGDMSKIGIMRSSSSTGIATQSTGFNSLKSDRSASGKRFAGVSMAREGSDTASSKQGTQTNNSSASASHTNMFDLLNPPESAQKTDQ